MAETTYIGKLLYGRYRVLHHMGRGGSARVYAAQDVLMDRQVALKILSDDETDLRLNTRSYETEVRAIAMLNHKNIVNVYDVSVEGNVKYIVMELVEGITLRELLDYKKEPMPVKEVVAGARQILDALQAAHGKGIVHRDIKPQNIMVMRSGLIKVADFGIARLPDSDRFRIKGRAVGTVHYISPEQATSKPVDGRSDLYSLGIVMYEMLTGKLPFDGDDVSRVALRQVKEQPVAPHLLHPDIPPELEAVVLRAMEKNPEDRYESAAAMRRALDRAVKEESGERRRGGFLASFLNKTDKKTTPNTTEEDHMNVILNRDKLNKKRNFRKDTEETLSAAEQTLPEVEENVTIPQEEEGPISLPVSEERDTLQPEAMEQPIGSPLNEVEDVTKILDELSADFIDGASVDSPEEDALQEDAAQEGAEEEAPLEEMPADEITDEEIADGDMPEDETPSADEEEAEELPQQEPGEENVTAEEEQTVVFGACDASMDTSMYRDTADMEPYEEIEDMSHTDEMAAAEPASNMGSTVAFGTVNEAPQVPLYTHEEDTPSASGGWGARVAAVVLGVALAATAVLSCWYTGFPFGTKVPELDVYKGEETIAGLSVHVEYVDSDQRAGTVLVQSPAAGYVRRADALYLQVSRGVSPYASDRVKKDMDQHMIGKTYAQAKDYLEKLAAGNSALPLSFVRVPDYSDTVPAGHIIGYDIIYNAPTANQTTAIVYVSVGADR